MLRLVAALFETGSGDTVTDYTVTTLLTALGGVLEEIIGSILDVMNTALQSPIVVIFIGCAFAGVIVGFAKKLLHF